MRAPTSKACAAAPRSKRNGGLLHRRSSLPVRDFETDQDLAEVVATQAGLTERQTSVLLRRAAGLTLAQIAAEDGKSKNGVFNVWLSALEKIERKRKEEERFARAATWIELRPSDRFAQAEPRVVREARAFVEAWERRKAVAGDAALEPRVPAPENCAGPAGVERARLNTVPRMLAEGAILPAGGCLK